MLTRPVMTERQLQDAVLSCARLFGYRAYHPWRSDHSAAGWPDLALVRARAGEPPRLLFAELKSANGKLSGEQQAWLDDLGRVADYATMLGQPALVSVHVWRPADWLDGTVEKVLRGI